MHFKLVWLNQSIRRGACWQASDYSHPHTAH